MGVGVSLVLGRLLVANTFPALQARLDRRPSEQLPRARLSPTCCTPEAP